MTTPSEQHHASPPPEENGGEEPGGEQLASSDEAAMEGEEIDEQLISEKLQRQVEFAQKLFDDRTLVPMPRPKMPEPRHRAFHIFWGIVLLLVVVFVRRLPRYPATQMPERVLEGDGLRYWETMQLLGSDIKAGLLRRLQGDPESARHFLEFSQLAKESADRRDKHEQRMYAFQKQLIQAFNPLLILRDRMGSTLDQLPPRKDKQPVNADELRAHLQALSAAAEEAFEVKNSFLREKILRKATDELHADPAVCRQLRRVMELEAAGMPRAAALLDFHVSQAMKAKEGGGKRVSVMRKEMLALQTKVQNAAADVSKAVAACMELLPRQHHWMLLLFVEQLPQVASPPAGKGEAEDKPERS